MTIIFQKKSEKVWQKKKPMAGEEGSRLVGP